tara:strand:+ start:1917 stop:2972 length:1056 start_codon:yes stop_codon:yes gene_type:complete
MIKDVEKYPKYISFLKENRTKEEALEIYKQRISDSSEIYKKFSNSFLLRSCPICGSKKFKEIDKFNNEYGVARCTNCNSCYVNPAPNEEALDYYYNNCQCNKTYSALLKKRSNKSNIIFSERVSYVLGLIEELLLQKKEIKILEVGANSGGFLSQLLMALRKKGVSNKVSLIGIDIDKAAVEDPISDDIELYHSSAEHFAEKTKDSYDLILHFELIEHLFDPFSFCCAIYKLLNLNGLMYFTTPNELGLDNQALTYNEFRPLAHGIFPPMHINSFTTQNVSHFLLRSNFSVREIKTPGNFDVDIVKEFSEGKNELSVIREIEDEKILAIIQNIIKSLGASSHLSVLALKDS